MRELAPGVEAAIRTAERLPHMHTRKATPLEGWQRLIFHERYAAEPGSIVAVILPRGHVKTTMAAQFVICDLLQTDSANVYMAATGLTQVGEMFRHAAHYSRLVGRGRIKVSAATNVLSRPDGGFARTLAADLSGQRTGKAQGYAPTFVGLDEFQAWRAMSLFIDLQTSLFKRGGVMLITGLPADRGHPLRALRDNALGGRVETGLHTLPDGRVEHHPDGRLTIARADMLTWVEWGLGPEEDWRDPDVCKLANPASWITPKSLSRDLVTPGVPEWAQRTMRACQWIDVGMLEWLPPEHMDSLAIGDPIVLDTEPFYGFAAEHACAAGLSQAFATGVACMPSRDEPPREPPDGLLEAFYAWVEARERLRHHYDLMAAAAGDWASRLKAHGALRAAAVDMGRYRDTTAVTVLTEAGGLAHWHTAVLAPAPEHPTPYAAVDALVLALTLAGVELIGWDPKYLDKSAEEWEAFGAPLIQVPQSTDRQITQSRALRDGIVSGVLVSDGNPVIAEQARNVKVQQVGAHGWVIRRGAGPVDVIVSGAMAWDLYSRATPAEIEPWVG